MCRIGETKMVGLFKWILWSALFVLWDVPGVFGQTQTDEVPAGVAGDVRYERPVRLADSLLSGRPTLILFSASWCGPCRLLQQNTLRDSTVRALLSCVRGLQVDVDFPEMKEWQQKIGQNEGIPEMVLFDREGYRIGSMTGYHENEQKTIDFMKQAFTDREFDSILDRRAEIIGHYCADRAVQRRRKMPFIDRLLYSRWTLNFGAGVAFSQFVSSDYSDYRTGFYVGATTSRLIGRRWEFETGLSLDALGGRSFANGAIRSIYLVLPAEMQYKLVRIGFSKNDCLGMNIFLSGGVYGAYRIGESLPDGVGLNRWDAGVRARFIFEMGSFRLSAGYSRGFVRCLDAGGYNQGFTVGLALCLGK